MIPKNNQLKVEASVAAKDSCLKSTSAGGFTATPEVSVIEACRETGTTHEGDSCTTSVNEEG